MSSVDEETISSYIILDFFTSFIFFSMEKLHLDFILEEGGNLANLPIICVIGCHESHILIMLLSDRIPSKAKWPILDFQMNLNG